LIQYREDRRNAEAQTEALRQAAIDEAIGQAGPNQAEAQPDPRNASPSSGQ
jgi:hypothetical protein